MVYMCMLNGMNILFWFGDYSLIVKDIQNYNPDVITIVPRFLEKLSQDIQKHLSQKTWITKFLINQAISRKIISLKSKGAVNSFFLDRLL